MHSAEEATSLKFRSTRFGSSDAVSNMRPFSNGCSHRTALQLAVTFTDEAMSLPPLSLSKKSCPTKLDRPLD